MSRSLVAVTFDANIVAGLAVGLTLFAIGWLVWFGTRERHVGKDDGPPDPGAGRG